MQELDPPVQIDPSVWATYEAAHVQAEAAIRAAEIGLNATWSAAVMQSIASVVGGLLALGAGFLAYRAAIIAADRQTKLEHNKHNAKVSAYGIRQEALIMNIIDETRIEIKLIKESLRKLPNKNENHQGDIKYYLGSGYENEDGFEHDLHIKISYYEEPSDWKDENWENHYLLGILFVKSMVELKEKYKSLNEAKEWLMKSGEIFGGSKNEYILRDIWVELPNGLEDFKLFDRSKALESYITLFSNLEKSLLQLHRVILHSAKYGYVDPPPLPEFPALPPLKTM